MIYSALHRSWCQTEFSFYLVPKCSSISIHASIIIISTPLPHTSSPTLKSSYFHNTKSHLSRSSWLEITEKLCQFSSSFLSSAAGQTLLYFYPPKRTDSHDATTPSTRFSLPPRKMLKVNAITKCTLSVGAYNYIYPVCVCLLTERTFVFLLLNWQRLNLIFEGECPFVGL